MEQLSGLQRLLSATPLAAPVRDLVWLKALLESAHILADGFILAAVAMVFGRLWIQGRDDEHLHAVARRFAPWIWGGMAVAFATGVALLTGAGRRGLGNPMFGVKLLAMALALLASAALQVLLTRRRTSARASGALRAAASVSLAAWIATVFAGRLLAYSSAFFA